MPEHVIRLRGPWDYSGPSDLLGLGPRVTLPTDWPIRPTAPFSLARSFGRPRGLEESEVPRLRLEGVSGLRELSLNGEVFHRADGSTDEMTLPLEAGLKTRNQLVLLVDPSSWEEGRPFPKEWGQVSLVLGG